MPQCIFEVNSSLIVRLTGYKGIHIIWGYYSQTRCVGSERKYETRSIESFTSLAVISSSYTFSSVTFFEIRPHSLTFQIICDDTEFVFLTMV